MYQFVNILSHHKEADGIPIHIATHYFPAARFPGIDEVPVFFGFAGYCSDRVELVMDV